MKKTTKKRLQLNVETVRVLQPLHEAQLVQVVGGRIVLKSASGASACAGAE